MIEFGSERRRRTRCSGRGECGGAGKLEEQVPEGEPNVLGHTLERMRSSLHTDVSVGTETVPHDIT